MTIIPFDQRDGVIWFNGEIVPWKEAKIHVLTHGLHYGSSVFEGERAYGGEIFKSREHSIRFHKSARDHGFRDPLFASRNSTPPRPRSSNSTAAATSMCAPSPGAARK